MIKHWWSEKLSDEHFACKLLVKKDDYQTRLIFESEAVADTVSENYRIKNPVNPINFNSLLRFVRGYYPLDFGLNTFWNLPVLFQGFLLKHTQCVVYSAKYIASRFKVLLLNAFKHNGCSFSASSSSSLEKQRTSN